MQFNGKFGCDFCLHPGKSVTKGKGHVRVYCEQSYEALPRYPLRTNFQSRNDVNESFKLNFRKPSEVEKHSTESKDVHSLLMR
ncbi:hypothetical protein OUZ56_012441 [Daphnia magna]|uniref:Uncharacterized protein n=1 Tax=Daphnia magna TaxID=35525 RepID=A0ABQ9Z304_9CRUS|nr:hypothetical protein OUZ56_012441 [Daphnia magna]